MLFHCASVEIMIQKYENSIQISKKHLAIGAVLILLAVALNILNTKTSGLINWMLIVFGISLVLVKSQELDLGRKDLGLERSSIVTGLKYGGIALAVVGLVLGLAYLINPTWFIDSRYNRSTSQVLITMFIFIPFHTVLIEELLFRGALLGLFMKYFSVRWAVLYSSLLFGLWHIVPSLGIAESSQTISTTLSKSAYAQLLSVIGVVLVTTVAGLVLCWLRLKSKSLLAPLIAHWAVNAFALLFATLAAR
ncbi:MAG: protease family protein [Patescibacteria group bacterium]|nr:protease family protein [Patescibacteria group bacterium]